MKVTKGFVRFLSVGKDLEQKVKEYRSRGFLMSEPSKYPIPGPGEPDNRFYQFPEDEKQGYGPPSFTRVIYCPYCGERLRVKFFPELDPYRNPTGAHYVTVHHCDSTFDLRTSVKRDKQGEVWEENRGRREQARR